MRSGWHSKNQIPQTTRKASMTEKELTDQIVRKI